MYPKIEIDLKKLARNTQIITDCCEKKGVCVTGVIKVCNGIPACAAVMAESGCTGIGSSRIDQLAGLKEAGIPGPLMLIRIPMMSEISDLVRVCDCSLNSEIAVIREINREAKIQTKFHRVILMIELGDLREGIFDPKEYVAAAKEIDQMTNVYLMGVGTNLGCYGSIDPTREKLAELVTAAERIEEAIDRKLELISGGGTTSLPRIYDGDMPERINHLRIGEGILNNRDLPELYNYRIEGMFDDIFTLKAEVIEARVKPSHPIGEIAFDAFRNKPTYVDRGNRKRVLLGMGKVDYAYPDQLIPRDSGVEILGASSDHTILDVEDAERKFKVGDLVSFDMCYAAVAMTTGYKQMEIDLLR